MAARLRCGHLRRPAGQHRRLAARLTPREADPPSATYVNACDMVAASGSERHGWSVEEVCTWVLQVVAGSQGETIAAVLKAEEVSGEVLFS